MTNRIWLPRVRERDPLLSNPLESIADRSMRHASITAGAALLIVAGLVSFGNLVVLNRLVTDGNATQTAKDIAASEGLFRMGIVSLLLVVALDVVIAWALYRVFSPVNRSISMLAAWFRLAYSAVFLVAISELVEALRFLRNDDYLAVFTPDQLHANALLRIDEFHDVWGAGVLLFGTHVLIVSYLTYRSRFFPRLLAVLLAIAGAGYVVDSFGAVLDRGSWTYVAPYTFVGEIVFALWLLIKGPRITLSAPATNDPIHAPRNVGGDIDLRDMAVHIGTEQRHS